MHSAAWKLLIKEGLIPSAKNGSQREAASPTANTLSPWIGLMPFHILNFLVIILWGNSLNPKGMQLHYKGNPLESRRNP